MSDKVHGPYSTKFHAMFDTFSQSVRDRQCFLWTFKSDFPFNRRDRRDVVWKSTITVEEGFFLYFQSAIEVNNKA